MITRREFLGTAALAGLLRRAPYKISLAAYSMRKYLDLKKPTMTLEVFLRKCREWGTDGAELTEYYFQKPVTPGYLAKLKALAQELNLAITGTPVGNNFTLPPGSARDGQIETLKKWIDVSADLGSPAIRIFAGSVPKGVEEVQARKWVVECIEACLGRAEEKKVALALENHGGVVARADGILEIARAIKSEWFGINLDTGNFAVEDPYAEIEKVASRAVTCQVKVEMAHGRPADLPRLVAILRKAEYKGYVTLEYEAAEEPLEAIPKHLAALRKAVE